MDILACRPEENSYNILPSAATMLFHGLPGGDVHGVVEEMDRRGKSESVAISSAIDMGESETVRSHFYPLGALAQTAWQAWKHVTTPSTLRQLRTIFFLVPVHTEKKKVQQKSQL